ncbi:MAG: alpha/beta hydrolase [Alphaproteobacteria bacterium]|nr:alpha/beta hydrolase [Alphaproteobacteria bacterium]
MSGVALRTVATPRGTFTVRERGAADAPLALLLHGFPDDASTFDALADALAARGWRCAAPYLRGYAPSPLDGDLGLNGLADDLLAIAEALSPAAPVAFVGHDYGGQIGCAAMARAPIRFGRAALLAAPHPAAIAANLWRIPRQWWLSRYIIGFQFGARADRRVADDGFAYVDRLWARWAPGFTPDPAHLRRVKATLAASMPQPAAMYRAGGFDTPASPIPVPTLAIGGTADGCIDPRVYRGQAALFPQGYEERLIDGVGHFLHLERPDAVAMFVADWLGPPQPRRLAG